MKLVGEDMRKYEYILDVFKGTCELNNFEGIKVPSFDEDDAPCNDVICDALAVKPENAPKVYFYCSELSDEETVILGAISDKKSLYSMVEMINMATKFLSNLNVEDPVVTISGNNNRDLQDNLEAVGIPVEVTEKGDAVFSVKVGEEEVIFGGVANNDFVFMSVDYRIIASKVELREDPILLDVYVAPSEADVLDDAFILGTDLRDVGFKVEVDYSLKQVTKDKVNATFLVTFDKEDIAKFEVKLIDMATKELKRVKIENLMEEIMFI